MGKFLEALYEQISLYVKQSAWLNACPQGAGSEGNKERPRQSRLQLLRAERGEDFEPDMPPLELDYLRDYFFEIGPVQSGGMGPAPLSNTEIRAWQSNTGIILSPWEARFIRRLSIDYLSQSHDAEESTCPAPWNDSQLRGALVAKSLRESIEGLAKL